MYLDIFKNSVLITAFLGWLIAQLLKVLIVSLKKGKIDFTRLVGSGGMPSSHSAFVVALATKVGKLSGFDSINFAISFCFAMVVMYDAAGVRRAAGKQARILNLMIEDLMHKNFKHEKLKELIGHTPVEVFAGAILGLFVGTVL
ncbi:Divergent PAP2 family protein [Caloramator mitchellensis]|uniref:Divergent PAP2 family protein n=1 Tax=Caloramator mitchellensis TaxID=908809 RepID=A0A0R3JUU0_CALMK|nr:divergent PAP2 family protein [Caloramator mitchellensis]KRQ86826.1 Divergent PAP2 family protein [Caloramator mitchellensis]